MRNTLVRCGALACLPFSLLCSPMYLPNQTLQAFFGSKFTF
jgi:hypothetical protein